MNQIDISYSKWTKKDSKLLFKSLRELLEIKEIQFYMPLFSLYFYIHNTPLSHKVIDFDRRYFIKDIKEKIKERYYNSNLIIKGGIYDSHKNVLEDKELFCKSIPILDPIHAINNNYNLINKNNHHLPGSYNYNTFSKINDINNGAYIDVFCSFLFGKLTEKNILPSFALFYGSANCIGEHKYDITEEYDDYKVDKCFNRNIGKTFKLDIFLSESEDESEDESENESEDESDIELSSDNSDKGSSSDSGSDYSYSNEDYITKIKNLPLQLLFIEKLEGTLEDYLLDDDFKEEVLLSGLFQIAFSLHYLQKNYEFTHNDLHINNIMFSYTEKTYLYYKINNKYFKVPTYGKIFKVIDFGRAIFTYKNKVYMNDVFSKYGEAGGQYYYPQQVRFHKEKIFEKKINPNYSFDLCRLSMTILDEINMDKISQKTLSLLNHMCTDKNNDNYCQMEDDFSLYILISKNSKNAIPFDILNKEIFKDYRVKKKNFPLKSYYSF